MYNTNFPVTVDAVTVLTAGDDDNKMHGIALKLLGTATDKKEFADLGYGKGAQYIDALLNGDLPIDDAVTLKISPREDVKMKFTDHEMNGIVVPVTITSIRVWPREGASWRFEIKTKSYHLKEAVAGKLVNSQRTFQHIEMWTTQGKLFDEKIEFTELPVDPTPAPEKDDTQQNLLGLPPVSEKKPANPVEKNRTQKGKGKSRGRRTTK